MEKLKGRALAAALIALALTVAVPQISAAPETNPEKTPDKNTDEKPQKFSRRNPFTEAVAKTRPSIVTVKVDKKGNWGTKEVIGTGVIVDERGWIITNSHVVTNSEAVRVLLSDGTELTAQIHTDDARHDLAILRISPKKELKAMPFGPGTDLLVGETVMAVGHPYGYRNSVSTGIISALDREISMPSGATLTNLIQTTTNINPGNSGGPLMNINGELIGINVALREGAQGIAFALNADTLQKVLADQLSAGKVAKVRHGLVCKEKVIADEGDERQLVVIATLNEKTPAALAGLKKGDVVKKIGKRDIANRFDVERAMWSLKVGDTIKVDVVRDGKDMQVSLKVDGSVTLASTTEEK